ncbi:MAG: hypothetical protein VYC39_16700 [Myxococcota bacterium]|nr:hypothetical protein [Myxococcota bacterium]
MKRITLLGFVVFIVALFSDTLTAEAHRTRFPKLLTIELREASILVTVSYTISSGKEATLLRALYDRDADGRLSGEEQERLTDYIERTAVMFLRMNINGELTRLVQRESNMQRLDSRADSRNAFRVQMRFAVTVPKLDRGETFTLSVEDRDKDALRKVPTVVDVGQAWSIVMASQGEYHPTTRQILDVQLDEENRLKLIIRKGPRPKPEP